MVDPQLKNNNDLVVALQNYETSWEKGTFFYFCYCIFNINISYFSRQKLFLRWKEMLLLNSFFLHY